MATLTITSYLIFQILVVCILLVVAYLYYVVIQMDRRLDTHAVALEGILYAIKDLAEGKDVKVNIQVLENEDDEDDD